MNIHKFESQHLTDILKHVDSNTFFIFDIDHTLIEPTQIIGSTHWERYLAKKLMTKGFTHQEAMIRAFHQWRTIQHLTQVKPVEDSIFQVMDYLKELKLHVLGLTARDGTLSDLTLGQLQSVNLDQLFSVRGSAVDLKGNYPLKFKNGTVFCGFNKKDAGLSVFLNHLNFKPKKIVFVDDQVSHINELENLAAELEIDYVGMTYHASGDHKFDSKIADIQERYLPKLISDQEALDLLEA